MNANDLPRLGLLLAERKGIKLSTVSTKFAGGGHVLVRIERGERSVSIRKYREIVERFDQEWPEDLPWPSDIPRPTSKVEDAAA